MKKGFTLVELLLVIGIMAVMGTIAVTSYSAATRGMADRAALDAAKSIADAALERARLDRTRTYLYCFNEVTSIDDDLDTGSAQGLLVAVRATGRITAVDNDCYYDEFNLERIESTTEFEEDEAISGGGGSDAENRENATITRIYRLASGASAQSGFMSVYEGNFSMEIDVPEPEAELNPSGNSPSGTDRLTIYGYKKVNGGEGGAQFEVGDLYGKEFAVTRLPPNYTFSQNVRMESRTDLGQSIVKVVEVKPEDESVVLEIFHRLPNGEFKSIGTTQQAEKGN